MDNELYRYRSLSLRSSAWQVAGLLAIFVASAVQCMTWFVFASVPYLSAQYFDFDRPELALNLFLIWSPITNCVFGILVIPRILRSPYRLIRFLRFGAILTFVGAGLRLVPMWLGKTDYEFPHREGFVLVLLHLAHLCTALSGGCFLAFPYLLPHLSLPFDPTHWAATLVHFGAPLGLSLGFIVGPLIVHESNEIPRLLYINLAIAAAAAIFGGVFVPPLNLAPHSLHAQVDVPQDFGAEAEWMALFVAPDQLSVFLLAGANALLAGANTGWLALLPFFLTCTRGGSTSDSCYDPIKVGAVGFTHVVSGLVGCFALTRLPPWFLNRRLKGALLAMLAPVTLIYVAVTLSLPSFLPTVFKMDYALLVLSLGVAGLLLQPSSPLSVELMAEVAYPSPHPDRAVCILSNLVTLLTLLFFPFAPDNWMNGTMAIATLISLLFVCFVTEEYRRSDALPEDPGSITDDT
eukprot:TRINITY_DN40663_c0_g1_i1.p1 TRINITY_DN40663_c0_g1~~TRINITY_DN40663_c0_g1_i1.p1  ORF type:complete len:476 (+),score=57.76 TRINITY_DN40663_c0_g1_i1:41-1429(+)